MSFPFLLVLPPPKNNNKKKKPTLFLGAEKYPKKMLVLSGNAMRKLSGQKFTQQNVSKGQAGCLVRTKEQQEKDHFFSLMRASCSSEDRGSVGFYNNKCTSLKWKLFQKSSSPRRAAVQLNYCSVVTKSHSRDRNLDSYCDLVP